MKFALTTEQRDFGDAVADLLGDVPEGPDRLAKLAGVGVTAVLVPEESGGAGGTEVDLLAPLEEAGRAAASEPLVESAVAAALLRGTDLADRLPALAAGEGFVAVTEPGTARAVDADRAALLLVQYGGTWHAATEFTAEARESLDPARRLFAVEATGPLTPLPGGADAADRGAALTAAYLVGAASRMIEMTVEYAGQRVQFGRAIGSYQAVKHQVADALVAVEFARPVAYRAAYSLATGSPTAGRDASSAKAMASDAALRTAKVALQVHGAIGYTMECDLHRWLRRAWSLAAAWGDTAHHRRRVADLLIGGDTAPARVP